MKLNPFYKSPFSPFFEAVSRREAAQLICQWRRSGNMAAMRKVVVGPQRGYIFQGSAGEQADLVLKEGEFVTR
jgi:hypothetical protein